MSQLSPLVAAFSALSLFKLPVLAHLVVDSSACRIIKVGATALQYTPRVLLASIAQRAPYEVGAGPFTISSTSTGAATLVHTYSGLANNSGPWTVYGIKFLAESSNQVTISQMTLQVAGTLVNRVAYDVTDTVQAGAPGPGGNNQVRLIHLPFENDSNTQGNATYCPLVYAGAGVAPWPASTAFTIVITAAGLPSGVVMTTELLTIGHPDIQRTLSDRLGFGGIQAFVGGK